MASSCSTKALRPVGVMANEVLGLRPMNCLFDVMYVCCSSVLIWLARFPSESASSCLSSVKLTDSLTVSIDRIPRRTLFSSVLFIFSRLSFTIYSGVGLLFYREPYSVYYMKYSKSYYPKDQRVSCHVGIN